MPQKKKHDIIIDEKRKRGGYEHVYPMDTTYREILRHETRTETLPFLIFSIGFSTTCGIMTFLLLRESNGRGLILMVLAIFGGMGSLSGLTALRREIQLQLDLWEGVITSVDGRVWVHHTMGDRRTEPSCKLEVDGIYFTLSKPHWSDFVNGQRYRVYYAPYTKIVVDSEPI